MRSEKRQWLAAAVLSLVFVLAGFAAADSPGAAVAVEEIRKEKGADFLKELFEVKGVRGETQPGAWVFLFNDPGARGGIREIVVKEGKIVSERTPVRSFGGTGDLPVLPVQEIRFDTPAIFRMANKEAVAKNFGFHWIDYTLRVDTGSGSACWFVSLTDSEGAKVADWALSASDLKEVYPMLREAGSDGEKRFESPQEKREEKEGVGGQPFAERGILGKVEGLGSNVIETIRRKSLDVAGGVEEVVTGERTIGKED